MFFFVAWTIRATLLFPIDRSISSAALGQVYADLLRVSIWVIPITAYIARIDRENPIIYLRLHTFGRKRAVFQSLIVTLLYFVIVLAVNSLLANRPLKLAITPLSNSWIKTFLVLTVAPLAEELVYRGFILQKLLLHWRPWKANLMTSCLFVAIHWPNWLYTGKAMSDIGMTSVQIFALSILLGYLVQKTGSLWPSILCHMLNNMISFFVLPG